MSLRRLVPFLCVVAVVTACRDSSSAQDDTGLPTAPEPVADQQSSTCRAYAANLASVRTALVRSPDDPVLLEREAAFRVIIADACN